MQVLSILQEVFPAVEAAEMAVKLRPLWWEGWQTLGRAQLNLGEVDLVSLPEHTQKGNKMMAIRAERQVEGQLITCYKYQFTGAEFTSCQRISMFMSFTFAFIFF